MLAPSPETHLFIKELVKLELMSKLFYLLIIIILIILLYHSIITLFVIIIYTSLHVLCMLCI